MNKWDIRFMELARHIATWSKDPSTKVGAVIVDDKRRVVSVGYNGFPIEVVDSEDRYQNREIKYKLVVHGEANALMNATSSLEGCTLYNTLMPCSTCAGLIIQAGIKKVIVPPIPDNLKGRWNDDMQYSVTMFQEAGVELVFVEEENAVPKRTNNYAEWIKESRSSGSPTGACRGWSVP